MTALTLITMVVVIGVVWGGFFWCLSVALLKERDKSENSKP